MTSLIYIILFCIIVFFLRRFVHKFKFPKCPSIAVFTGGVKVGKSALSLACALDYYKKAVRQVRFKNFFLRIINNFRKKKNRKPLHEKPLLYSNIPLRHVSYVQLTKAHILREVRFNYKSVIFVDEASLLADSQLIKVPDLNVKLLLFFKLIGHETHGGKCIFNSHNISDLHYALKRTTSQYFYIHSLTTWFPFIMFGNVREERFSEDGSDINVYNEDVEDTLRKVIIRKRIFKKYDSFCYSNLTDNLPTKNIIVRNTRFDSLKAVELPSFRPEFSNLFSGVNHEKENS